MLTAYVQEMRQGRRRRVKQAAAVVKMFDATRPNVLVLWVNGSTSDARDVQKRARWWSFNPYG